MLNVDGIALVKNAHPHPKRKKLVQYLTSRSVQQRLVAEFDAKSIRKDVSEQSDQSIENLKNIPLIPKSKLPDIPHHKFFGDDSMTAYKPYRHQLRRSLFASTIFPVFLVIIIGLVASMPSIFGLSIVRFINMLMKVSYLYITLKSRFRHLLHSIIIRFKSSI